MKHTGTAFFLQNSEPKATIYSQGIINFIIVVLESKTTEKIVIPDYPHVTLLFGYTNTN